MEDHSKLHNKPSTQDGYQYQIDNFVISAFGTKKVLRLLATTSLR